MSTQKLTATPQVHGDAGLKCSFNQIESPGCYVSTETGRLLRVPADALAKGQSPKIETVGSTPWIVTRLSSDPYLPISKARMIAADIDIEVNF